jgi:lipase chaperone LimK
MRARHDARLWLAALAAGAAVIAAGMRIAGPAARAVAPDVAVASPTAAPRAVSSLAGTTPDGDATASADDQLILDPGLIRLFDYYLSTVGERPIADIRAQVERDLDARLKPRAARQAKDVLARYLEFKQALRDMKPRRLATGRSVDTLRAALRSMQDLRAGYFSAGEVQLLFAHADDEASAALQRMAIEQDPSLDPAARTAKLAALDATLPADVRAAREAPLAVVHLQQAAEQIRAQGGSEDDVYRMRAAATSPEAANRLADVDRDEAAWQARIAAYQAQRAAVLSTPGSDADRQAATSDLRNRLFTPDEQRRLAAYEG